jgi:peptidoglycan/LPS O-acetylase OafA/YrhL
MDTTLRPNSSRLLGLDLLRLLAVLGVIAHHAEAAPDQWTGPWASTFRAWQNLGGLGVDLFFVLSGFLVSGLLFSEYKKHGDISIKRFYVRRAWRIYPAFYTLIVFSYLAYWLGFSWKMRDKQIFSELFFLQNYIPAFWNHTWTLALEEHFYVLLPLILLWLVRRNAGASNPFRSLPLLVGVSSVLFLAIRVINFAVRTKYSYYTHAWASHLRMDALFFGVGVAYAYHFHFEAFSHYLRPMRYLLIATGIAILLSPLYASFVLTSWYYHTVGFTQTYLGAAALMVGLLMCRIADNAVTRGLAALGAYSYSIYLWHMALMYWVLPKLKDRVTWELRTLLFFVGAFVIGLGMAKALELPLLRMRDRWYPSRTADQVPAVPTLPQQLAQAA